MEGPVPLKTAVANARRLYRRHPACVQVKAGDRPLSRNGVVICYRKSKLSFAESLPEVIDGYTVFASPVEEIVSDNEPEQ